MTRKSNCAKTGNTGASAAGKRGLRNALKPKDLEDLRKALLRKREQMAGDVDQMTDETLRSGGGNNGPGPGTMPIHMADLGSDNYERDFTAELLQTETEEIKAIDKALARMEEGTFGTCGSCGKAIRKMRLRALPHAGNCIGCQRKEELEKG